MTTTNTYQKIGILEIIVGILIILLPLFYFFTTSRVTGMALVFLGVAWLILSLNIREDSTLFAILVSFIGALALLSGLAYFIGFIAFDPLITTWTVVVGILLIIFGALTFLFRQKINGQWGIIGILSVILGLIYVIIGIYAQNPYYLAVLIGIFLIADGASIMFIKPAQIIQPLP